MLTGCERPREVATDFAVPLLSVVDLVPGAVHDTTKYANTRVECDHGRLKARLEPMRGLGTDWTASMNNVTATATGGSYSYGVGNNGSSPSIRNSSITGTTKSIDNYLSCPKVADTALGGAVGGGGFTCVGVYATAFVALGTTCAP